MISGNTNHFRASSEPAFIKKHAVNLAALLERTCHSKRSSWVSPRYLRVSSLVLLRISAISAVFRGGRLSQRVASVANVSAGLDISGSEKTGEIAPDRRAPMLALPVFFVCRQGCLSTGS